MINDAVENLKKKRSRKLSLETNPEIQEGYNFIFPYFHIISIFHMDSNNFHTLETLCFEDNHLKSILKQIPSDTKILTNSGTKQITFLFQKLFL